jgi:hypothetical protein
LERAEMEWLHTTIVPIWGAYTVWVPQQIRRAFRQFLQLQPNFLETKI